MGETPDFAKLVPGFDFMQGLVKNAGAAMPSIGQWVAPTLNPEDLEKRISELRAVQYWLEQNARVLAATIQALEVQRMTLSTLKTMNVQMEDLREAMLLQPGNAATRGADAATAAPTKSTRKAPPKPAASAPVGAKPMNTGVVDPMQWWGALTQQFSELASTALQEGATQAARTLAGAVDRKPADASGATAKPTRSTSRKKPRHDTKGAAPHDAS